MRSPPTPAFFDAAWYLARNMDVAQAGMDPLRHYLRFGRSEGRLPCALVGAGRARDLNYGLADISDFAPLLADPARPERVWAAVALARAHAAKGNWQATTQVLRDIDLEKDLIQGFALPDPVLLMIEAHIKSGDLPRAQSSLTTARRAFGRLPDLALAQANIIAARSGIGPTWQRSLRALYARHRLRGPGLMREGATAFDRLSAKRWRTHGQHGPVVSVLVPAHDAGGSIDTALQSLRDQSWQSLEILVIDNGSRDDTAARVTAHAQQDGRIQLLDGKDEPGAYAARNLGFATATGDFITTLDADDWAHPARIHMQVSAMVRDRKVQASLSHWVRTTEDLHFARWWGDAGLVHRNMSSLMIRASLRDSLGFWDRARAGADTEYMERILAIHGASAVIDVAPGMPLSFGRVHAGALTQTSETHISTQHYGVRRSYLMAARRWHAGLVAAPAPLQQRPLTRPFPLPEALSVGDAPGLPGPTERLAHSAFYDDAWVMQTYPDLRARDVDGVSWYLSEGAAAGRDPGPTFSTTGYELGVDVGNRNPLLHALVQDEMPTQAVRLPDLHGDLPKPPPRTHQMFVGHQAGPSLFGAERSFLDMLDRAIAVGITPSVLLPHLKNEAYRTALAARCYRIHLRPFGWRYGHVPPPPVTVEVLTKLLQDTGVTALHQNTCVLEAPLRAAKAAGIPATVHVRELANQNASLCFDLGVTAPELRNQLIEGADHLVANAPAVARWLNTPGVHLRPNSVDPALFDLPFTPETPPRVALVGSLTHEKGFGDMVTLARRARAKGTALRFVLIGPDSPALSALGTLPEGLTHAGYANSPKEAMAQTDIVMSLSKVAESYGRTLAEAMAAGRPVLTYDRGAPPDLVGRDGSAGQVVQADDVDAVLEALEAMLATPGGLQTLSTGARARAREIEAAASTTQDRAIYAAPPA